MNEEDRRATLEREAARLELEVDEFLMALRSIAGPMYGECRSCAVKDPLGLALEEEDDELPARSSTA